jgi:polyisoprenoid-binding protein YceI
MSLRTSSYARKGLYAAAIALVASAASMADLNAQLKFVIAPDTLANQARYRVREQLANVDFPNDAIGKTNKITGQIVFNADGTVSKEQSKFTINVASLTSPRDRRDNFIKRNTLQTEQYPNVTFVPVAVTGLRFPLPDSADVAFKMTGDLTIRDQTKLVTWNVMAKLKPGGEVIGAATTMFTFTELGLTKPRVQSVLSVNDEITLEFDFKMIPQK